MKVELRSKLNKNYIKQMNEFSLKVVVYRALQKLF